ncbi:DNL zinc finger-domain-containing protein [Hypoxylon sp. NC1633]|nr:DNL zinc finger-domain-containing protein [Hypoxylon sp. NC1633]
MASRSITSVFLKPFLRPSARISPSIFHPSPRLSLTSPPAIRRFANAIPKPPSQAPSDSASEAKPRKLLEPHYELTFTCVPCGERSTHAVSKQGYHHGSVLITCPSCRNRHVISDHLNIFGDRKITVEDLMRERGQLVKRGTLGEDGDVEFWEDGTVTERGAGAGTATGSSNGAAARDSSGVAAGEDEAVKLREARDPSARSAGATPVTPTPLGIPGGRPSVDSTQHADPTPSTRRQ